MNAIEALKTRRSVRVYKQTPVSREIIEDIVDCGRLAASAINIQPWVFIAVTEQPIRHRIAELTDYGKFIANAPVCIAVFCEKVKYYLEDGCAASQNILVAARAHGLGTCWIAGDKKEYADAIRLALGVPETHTLVSLIAMGYPEASGSPGKKPLKEVLRWEKF